MGAASFYSDDTPKPLSRREALRRSACGFGNLALAALLGPPAAASLHAGPQAAARAGARGPTSPARDPLAARPPHFRPRARRVIFLFMQGGPSQVDTFDPKPLLEAKDGERLAFDDARAIANTGERGGAQRVMRSPWKFARHGASGLWVSDLFPHVARLADDLCLIRSMHTEGVAHGPATLFLHTGAANLVRPSLGAWVAYGLGTESRDLPAFVSIAPPLGNGGPRNHGSAFLPASYQGTPIGTSGRPAAEITIRNLDGGGEPSGDRRRRLDILQALNAEQLRAASGDTTELEAVIGSFELAWRMQAAAPGIIDLSGERPETLALYGIGARETDDFGRQCLLARRFAEAGVRFIQVSYGDNTANPRWDQHSNLPRHADHARAVDRPIAGLLADLKRRGLLEETLVWWGGEFGRTPYAEKNGTGRDHNPGGFTVWLAGGGVKPGFALGATDEFGHLAVENPVHMRDLHATVLHLLGLDHERLTYRFDGRDFRLTDVGGRVVGEVLA